MPPNPLLRDDTGIYGRLLQEMFHEYVASDTFCSHPRQEREELVGAYEEITALMASEVAKEHKEIMVSLIPA